MRILFDFKGAHEIASLSCYFLILQKVEEKNAQKSIIKREKFQIGESIL